MLKSPVSLANSLTDSLASSHFLPSSKSIVTRLVHSLSFVEQKVPLTAKAKLIAMAPKMLKPCSAAIPSSVQKPLLLSALNSIFNEAIEDGDFEFLQDKWLKISIMDLQLDWWLSFDENKLVMATKEDTISEDVCFSANSDDLLLIAGRKQDPDTLFFQRRLKIEGDTELGLSVKNLIDAIDLELLPSSFHDLVNFSANFLQSTRNELALER